MELLIEEGEDGNLDDFLGKVRWRKLLALLIVEGDDSLLDESNNREPCRL